MWGLGRTAGGVWPLCPVMSSTRPDPEPTMSYYGQPPPQFDPRYAPAPGPSLASKLIVVLIALGVVLILAAGAGAWVLYDRGLILKDSGVVACESMRQRADLVKASADREALSEQQYRAWREAFAGSRFGNIRERGTRLMDLVWQVTQISEDESDTVVLMYASQLLEQTSGLQSACADQGVIIDLAGK